MEKEFHDGKIRNNRLRLYPYNIDNKSVFRHKKIKTVKYCFYFFNIMVYEKKVI